MKKMCILAKEKVELPLVCNFTRIQSALDLATVPWYVIENGKVVAKHNCDEDAIAFARRHALTIKVRTRTIPVNSENIEDELIGTIDKFHFEWVVK